MTAVRVAVSEVLVRHRAEARVEVSVRIHPTVLVDHRSVAVEVSAAATEASGDADALAADADDIDQVRAYQEARFRALEL